MSSKIPSSSKSPEDFISDKAAPPTNFYLEDIRYEEPNLTEKLENPTGDSFSGEDHVYSLTPIFTDKKSPRLTIKNSRNPHYINHEEPSPHNTKVKVNLVVPNYIGDFANSGQSSPQSSPELRGGMGNLLTKTVYLEDIGYEQPIFNHQKSPPLTSKNSTNRRYVNHEEPSPDNTKVKVNSVNPNYIGRFSNSPEISPQSSPDLRRGRSNVLTKLDPRLFLTDHLAMLPESWRNRFFWFIEEKTRSNLALTSKLWYQFIRQQSLTIIQGQSQSFLMKKSITHSDAKKIFNETGIFISIEGGKNVLTDFKLSGEGNFGEIRLGLAPQPHGAKVVLIKITRGQDASQEEVEVQKYLKDLPLIVPLLDWRFDRGFNSKNELVPELYQIMPPSGLGSATFFCNLFPNVKDTQFADFLLYHIADHLLKALLSMHEKNVIHRDVKPSNLVVDQDEIIKLIDFGCSCYASNGKVTKSGDNRYWPPEMFFQHTFDGEKVDSWMAGMTLYEIVTGKLPWNFSQYLRMIKSWSPEERPEKLQKFVKESLITSKKEGYWPLIQKLLTYDPNERITVKEALQDPWIQQMRSSPHIKIISQQIKQYAQTSKEQKVSLASCQNLPVPHVANYLPRASIEKALKEKLLSADSSTVVCQGPSGIGKTELVNYVLHDKEITSTHNPILWFRNANESESLDNQYLLLAKELRLAEKEISPQEAKIAVEEYLNLQATLNKKPWLVVFDHAKDPSSLNPYLLKGKGNTIITTHSSKWENVIKIGPLSLEETENLIRKLIGDIDPQTSELAKILDGHTLGVIHACAYIRNNNLSISDYLKILNSRNESSSWVKINEIFSNPQSLFGQQLPKSLFNLWEVTLLELEEKNPESIIVLHQLSCLGAEEIPMAVLSLSKQKVIDPLFDYSLLNTDLNRGTFTINSLLKEMLFHKYAYRDRKTFIPNLMENLNSLYIEDPVSEKERSRNLILFRHGQFLIEEANNLQIEDERLIGTLSWVGHLLMDEFSQVEHAKKCFEKALQIGEKIYGKESLLLINPLNLLGEVFLTLEKGQEASKFLMRALELSKEVPSSPKRAVTYNLLGRCNKLLGNIKGAEEYYNLALKEIKQQKSHERQRIFYLNNLAELIKNENPSMALGLNEEANSLVKKYYSQVHYRRAILLTTRAGIYKILNNEEESINHYIQALEIAEKAYNPEHPALAIYYCNLGLALKKSNVEEGIEFLKKGLLITEKIFGANSQKVYPLLYSLGIAYKESGELTKALSCLKKVFVESKDPMIKQQSALALKTVMTSLKATHLSK